MAMKGLASLVVAAAVVASAQPVVFAQEAAAKAQALGSVRITTAVRANGAPLAPGTYTLRLTTETPSPVVGQTPAETRWVEFVQGGEVKGREVATVMTPAELEKISESRIPASGTAKTEMLKGNDYLRVWVNRGVTHYLVHLAAG